ncbi:hypothetical protein [Candidatus Enterococcus mansonii]|uniref:Uncharacterized protein n=1 Tax=Candidatus Enterococcus mansonii TaxID=1834181 RepID=A0A242CGW2_9ENTE|nr:hypothetical protein [Enterococcus sp. 4G2_DIV0659]OTO09451.1 hypothetical protein A5880_000130 [Enterococcus sp. 4G2_DIV0659]
MFNKRKIKKWFKFGQQAWSQKDYQQAVYFFKLVVETSVKYGGIQRNDCFRALVFLGDIYQEALCFKEADNLYQMAAGMDFSAKLVLLEKELFHAELKNEKNKQKWLQKNMIDHTNIIQTKDGKTWTFLIEDENHDHQAILSSKNKETNGTSAEEIKEDDYWSYEDYLETTIV